MEMTQYQKDVVRMWDSLRKEYKGKTRCTIVNCKVCPLHECCNGKGGNISFNAEKAIEVVNNWAKEHPIITNEEKFKEVWGYEPKSIGGFYLCPSHFGFEECTSPFSCSDNSPFCEACRQNFWKSEYKPPKKEGKES